MPLIPAKWRILSPVVLVHKPVHSHCLWCSICLCKVLIDIIDDHISDITEALKHEKEHGSTANKWFYISDIIPLFKVLWKQGLELLKELWFATDPFNERFRFIWKCPIFCHSLYEHECLSYGETGNLGIKKARTLSYPRFRGPRNCPLSSISRVHAFAQTFTDLFVW